MNIYIIIAVVIMAITAAAAIDIHGHHAEAAAEAVKTAQKAEQIAVKKNALHNAPSSDALTIGRLRHGSF
jgi:flagellar basal body-associated protein FliL